MRDETGIAPLVLIVVLLSFAACGNAPTNVNGGSNTNASLNVSSASADPNSNANRAQVNSAKSATHEHHAPHGGTLVEFGEEFAHLELVLDAEVGELTAYALDGEAEKSVPLAQAEIEIEVLKPARFVVKLAVRENALTGEKTGATSEFRGRSEQLKNLNDFDAAIKSITIRAGEFKNVTFNCPRGNEIEK